MTRNQIVHWRNQADAYARTQSSDHYEQRAISDERFAQLARADERERCAAECDAAAEEWRNPNYHFATASAKQCAAAIRARKD